MAESNHEIETSSEDVEKYCDACKLASKTKLAIVYCDNCKQFQCDACNEMHRQFPVMFGHTIVNIEDKTGIRNFDMQGIDRCEKHKEEIQFYCTTDNELCCHSCIVSDHLKCGHDGILDEFTATNDDQTRELQNIIQAKLFTSAAHQLTIPRIQKELREDQSHKLQEIDNIKDKVNQLFDTFKAEFKFKSDEAINDTCGSLDLEMTSCKQLDENLRRVEAFLYDVTKNGTPAQVFNALDVYKKQVDNLKTNGRPDQTQLSSLKIDIKFHQKVLQLIEKAIKTVQMTDVFTPKKLSLEISSKLKKSKTDANIPFYTGLDFFQDGRIVAVDNHNNTWVVMNGKLSILGEWKLEKQPYDVAVLPDNSVAISHADKEMSLHTVNDDNTQTHIKTLKTKSSFNSLFALDNNTLVASTYECDRPVKLVALTGEEKDFDLPFAPTSYRLYKSRCTFITSSETLVLTDRDDHTCYLQNVKEKLKITLQDEKQIKEPRGVCATTTGQIFICSYGTKSIVQISAAGEIVDSLTLSQHPVSVALSRDDKQLLVFAKHGEKGQLHRFNIT